MTLVIANAYQVVIEMSASGQQLINVIGILDETGEGDDSPGLIGNYVKTAWEIANGPLAKMSSQVSMVGYHVTALSTETSPKGSVGSTTAGGLTGQSLNTLATCAVIKLSSASRSRSMNGRLYHGGLTESNVNDDGRTINGGHLTALTTAYANFKSSIDGSGVQWAVLSRKLSIATPVHETSVGGIIGIQRRRLR